MVQIECKDLYGKAHLEDPNDIADSLHVYGIYFVDNKILLIQDPHSQRWEFPGGRVEAGETTRQAVAREFTEETGMTISGNLTLVTAWIEYFFDIGSNQAWRAKREFYSVSGANGAILVNGNNLDSIAAKFIPVYELDQLDITVPIRNAIKLAQIK